jgi:hypothetical protein
MGVKGDCDPGIMAQAERYEMIGPCAVTRHPLDGVGRYYIVPTTTGPDILLIGIEPAAELRAGLGSLFPFQLGRYVRGGTGKTQRTPAKESGIRNGRPKWKRRASMADISRLLLSLAGQVGWAKPPHHLHDDCFPGHRLAGGAIPRHRP